MYSLILIMTDYELWIMTKFDYVLSVWQCDDYVLTHPLVSMTQTLRHFCRDCSYLPETPVEACSDFQFNSIQFNFICVALLTKELCHKAALQRTGPHWVSLGQQWQGKTPWRITGRNLEQNRTQRGNHLPLVGTGFSPMYWVSFESSHVGMRWRWQDEGARLV